MSLQLTPHFTVEEFDCHDGSPYPPDWIEDRLLPLCAVLEKLRENLGGVPITIISGYRSPAHNQSIGGAQKSQHMEGKAADISVKGCSPALVHAALLNLFNRNEIEIGGLGIYPGWCHVDIRDRPADGHLAQWTGGGFGAEQAG